jgi:hypothetical protein
MLRMDEYDLVWETTKWAPNWYNHRQTIVLTSPIL